MTQNKNDEPLTLDEIHHVTLDVLKKIQEICKAHLLRSIWFLDRCRPS